MHIVIQDLSMLTTVPYWQWELLILCLKKKEIIVKNNSPKPTVGQLSVNIRHITDILPTVTSSRKTVQIENLRHDSTACLARKWMKQLGALSCNLWVTTKPVYLAGKYAFFFGCSVKAGSSSNDDDIVADNENCKESI